MAPCRQKGFSLVEAMVGITVGLVTVLVITQVLSTFQGTRNSTAAGADAQENGLFAIQAISSDVRASGAGSYSSGTITKSIYPCTNVCSYDSNNGSSLWCSNPANPAAVPAVAVGTAPIAAMSGAALTGATYKLPTPLAPIVIEGAPPGVSNVISYAPGSDVITLRNSGRFIGSVPTGVSAAVDMSSSNPVAVLRTFGFAAGDLAVITDETNCSVFQVTAVDATGLTLTHGSATYNPSSSDWSAMPGASNAKKGVNYANTSQVYNLGSTTLGAIGAREYSVAGPNGGSLQFREMKMASIPFTILPLADNIVALKAQYGIAASATSPSVASWMGTDCTTSNCAVAWTGNWDPGSLTKDKVMLIRAVRLLVVARNGNKEASIVTPACTASGYTTGPCPSGGTTQADTTLPAINFSGQNWAAANAWQYYRYKIYITAVPIRNVLWNGSWSNQGE